MGRKQVTSNKRAASGSDDEVVEAKTIKRAKSEHVTSKEMQTDSNGNVFWELSQRRRVQINYFKDMLLVDIRETYEKDGQMLPGKKGISLTIEQFSALLKLLPDLDKALCDKGETVPRPQYDSKVSDGLASPVDGDGQSEVPQVKEEQDRDE